MKKIFTFVLSILSLNTLFSQEYYRYPVINYSTKDYGVFQGQQNWAVVQDDDWNIYIGNDNGVLLYNGLSWRHIPVVLGQKVYSMALGSDNKVFVGCSGGQFGFLEKNKSGKFNYTPLSENLKEEDRPISTIWRIFSVNGIIYFQCNEAIYVYSNNKLEIIRPENSFHLALCTGDEVYARDRNKGLVRIKGNKCELVNDNSILKEYGLFALLKDEKNPDLLILVTQELGLFRVNRRSGELSEIKTTDKEFLISSKIYGAKKLPGNLFALNTQYNGVVVIDNNGVVLRVINEEVGLMNNYVIDQFYDKAGNLWLALEKGIAKVEWNSSLQIFDEKSGFDGTIRCSGLNKNETYLGTSTGLFVKDNKDAKFKRVDGVGPVWKISVSNNMLFASSENGLFSIKERKASKLFDGNCRTFFYSKVFNKYILGTNQGVYSLDENFKNQTVISADLGEIYQIAEGKTESDSRPFIWATSTQGNTVAINLDSNKINLKYFTKENGLPHEWIYPFELNGKILFGSNYGLLELKGKTFDENVIFDIASLSGKKIESSFSYLEKINDLDYYYVSENALHHYQAKTGLNKKLQMIPISFGRINDAHYSNNKLLVSCSEGAVAYEEKNDLIVPPVVVRKILLNGDSVFIDGGKTSSFNIDQAIEYEYNNIQFFFSAGDFSNEEYNQYFIKLEGSDTLISDWKNGNSISFNNLREGTYKLKIKYKNAYGRESDELQLQFTILPPWYRSYAAYFGYVLILIIALISSAKIASFRLRKQKKVLEEIVAKRTAEIAGKNDELAARNLEILHQKQEITDSINYAKRIQTAILPSTEEINKIMQGVFVLFLPKDIVSGDFYWFHKINENEFLIACADCTGHGVPGGFMSMICAEKLNEAATQFLDPSEILSMVNKSIKKSLRQDGNVGSTKDGMEIALLKVSVSNKMVVYSGANRFLWLIRSNENSITEFKPTKAGIAGTTPDEQKFEEHTIQLSDGDSVYISSDGFGDQFGGEKQKKLTTKRFKEILLENKNLKAETEHDFLKQYITNWRGDLEQIDDILVIGLKF